MRVEEDYIQKQLPQLKAASTLLLRMRSTKLAPLRRMKKLRLQPQRKLQLVWLELEEHLKEKLQLKYLVLRMKVTK